MPKGSTLRNLHVPLSDPAYRRLRAESERSKRPATELAREAILDWLERARRAEIHEAIAQYAAEHGGRREDLDVELEASAVEHLRGSRPKRRR